MIPTYDPFLDKLGVQLVLWREGHSELHMPISASHLNRFGVLQGGAIATLMDVACGFAGLYDPAFPEKKRNASTLSLNIQYLQTGLGEMAVAKGTLRRAGKSIFFSQAEAWVGEVLIATAQGTFKYLPAP